MEDVKNNTVLNNSNIIKNISYDQKEILWNIMQLHNNGKPFDCDMTASSLKFYEQKKSDKYIIPEPKILFDVYPQQEKIKKIYPYKELPLEGKSIESIVIDLPFIVSPPNAPSMLSEKEGSNIICKRFASFYPVSDLYAQYKWWIDESYRVLKDHGICVFKCQSMISGGISHMVELYSAMCAMNAGYYIKDQFILEAKARLISPSKYKAQQHSRKYTSVFWVFEKGNNKAKKVNYFNMIKPKDETKIIAKISFNKNE